MSEKINEKTIEHLATLARIELEKDAEKNKKLHTDLSSILNYFESLKDVDTTNVSPTIGSALEKNVYREDKEEDVSDISLLKEQFPKSENGYLKTPPVFD
ncbi:MAG: Asp-tRNA(Asn)/Glu-tRNA(Gln) amidotransferase subunit GatC [Patescibacteria group bacterium]